MREARYSLLVFLLALPGWSATFGTVVAQPGSYSDIVLDESHRQLYLANTGAKRIDVYGLATNPPRLVRSISTSGTPYAIALARSSKYLYVASYESASLDVIDLSQNRIVNKVALPAGPEGVAVGGDERVLISTVGTTATTGANTNPGTNTLLVYDPNAAGAPRSRRCPCRLRRLPLPRRPPPAAPPRRRPPNWPPLPTAAISWAPTASARHPAWSSSTTPPRPRCCAAALSRTFLPCSRCTRMARNSWPVSACSTRRRWPSWRSRTPPTRLSHSPPATPTTSTSSRTRAAAFSLRTGKRCIRPLTSRPCRIRPRPPMSPSSW